jgi:hypothetical protein
VLFMLKGNYVSFCVYLGEVKPLMALGKNGGFFVAFQVSEHNLKSIPKLTWLL